MSYLVAASLGALVALVFVVAPMLGPSVRVWRHLLRAQELTQSLPADDPLREVVEASVVAMRSAGWREPRK